MQCLPCAIAMLVFYRSARAFKRTLRCHKRNNSGWNPSALTEEVVLCPPNIGMVSKSVANILGIYFKCRKGRGPYLSSRSSPRRMPLSGIMFLFWHSVKYFSTTSTCKQPRGFWLYFHVCIITIRRTGDFLLIFEINISGRRWRTSDQPLATRLLFWRFMPICRAGIWIGIVGSDTEDPREHYDVKKIALDNLFIFLIILWKHDECKKRSVFPCAALSGCFLARLIVTWIHFLVNELQECDSIDSMCRRLISFFAK